MAGNFAHRERRGGFMPDERQEARNDARYGRRQEEENRGDEMQGGSWSDERRMREGRQGERYGSDEGWGAQREEWRGGSPRRGSGNYASDWMNESSGSSAGDRWRSEYGGGYGGRDMSRGYGSERWRNEGARGGDYGERERWSGGGYGGWEGSRGYGGGPDHSRGGGFTGPQDSYTRGMQDDEMPAGWRGGLGGMPGGWPGGRGGEQYGRGSDYWRGDEGGHWRGLGRFGSDRWGDESRGQRSFRGLGPKGYQRSDERLKEVVCERLSEDDHIDASEISLEVKNGEVTLSGQVPERSMKYHAEDLIEQCGVREIHNNLRVQSGSRSASTTASGMQSGSAAQSGQGSGMSDKASSEGRGAGQSGSHKS